MGALGTLGSGCGGESGVAGGLYEIKCFVGRKLRAETGSQLSGGKRGKRCF